MTVGPMVPPPRPAVCDAADGMKPGSPWPAAPPSAPPAPTAASANNCVGLTAGLAPDAAKIAAVTGAGGNVIRRGIKGITLNHNGLQPELGALPQSAETASSTPWGRCVRLTHNLWHDLVTLELAMTRGLRVESNAICAVGAASAHEKPANIATAFNGTAELDGKLSMSSRAVALAGWIDDVSVCANHITASSAVHLSTYRPPTTEEQSQKQADDTNKAVGTDMFYVQKHTDAAWKNHTTGLHIATKLAGLPNGSPVPAQHGLRVAGNYVDGFATGIRGFGIGDRTSYRASNPTWLARIRPWLPGNPMSPLLELGTNFWAFAGKSKAAKYAESAMFDHMDGYQPMLWAYNRVRTVAPKEAGVDHGSRAMSYLDPGSGLDFENLRAGQNDYVAAVVPTVGQTGETGYCAPMETTPGGATQSVRLWPFRVQLYPYDQGNDQCVFASLEGQKGRFSGLQGEQVCYRFEEGSKMVVDGAGVGGCDAIATWTTAYHDDDFFYNGHALCPLAQPDFTSIMAKSTTKRGWLQYFAPSSPVGAPPAADLGMCFYDACSASTVPSLDCQPPKGYETSSNLIYTQKANKMASQRCSVESKMRCRQ